VEPSFIDEAQQAALVAETTARLEAIQDDVLDLYVEMSGKPRRLQSLHGTIGGKNNTFVDAVREQFMDPRDFQARWLSGLLDEAEGRPGSAAARLVEYMQEPLFREYTLVFLERNFYKNHLERTRAKPDSTLWQVWFGDNKSLWGLLIAPAFRLNGWTNDVSEIRRARFHYWTVGHVLATGVVDPSQKVPLRFVDLDQFLVFYRGVVKRLSNSLYESAIFDRYAAYLERSDSPELEPLLIPELRYGGPEANHEHRLDFTVLNPHTMQYVGFELSPFSTHGAVKKMREKTQADVNREGATRWAAEMGKRNSYFADFGITTVTFTDPELVDMDACFSVMAGYLSARSDDAFNLDDQLERLVQAGV